MGWPIPASPESVTVALGKRRRDVSHEDVVPVLMNSHEMPAQVRSDIPNGILKTAWSASGTHHKSVTRIPKQKINSEPRGTGSEIEGLAIPDSLGIHHQSLLGSSLQQGWAVEAASGQLTRVEGSVEEVGENADGTARQQEQEEAQQEYFDIPKDLKTGYQALLMPTGHAGQFARSGAVSVPTPSSKSGENPSGTVTAMRRTRLPRVLWGLLRTKRRT